MIYGLVDVGANSIRLSIYEAKHGNVKLLGNKKDTAGLSSHVKNGAVAKRFHGDIILANNYGVREGYLFTRVLRTAG